LTIDSGWNFECYDDRRFFLERWIGFYTDTLLFDFPPFPEVDDDRVIGHFFGNTVDFGRGLLFSDQMSDGELIALISPLEDGFLTHVDSAIGQFRTWCKVNRLHDVSRSKLRRLWK
jgi:hypothetical protein